MTVVKRSTATRSADPRGAPEKPSALDATQPGVASTRPRLVVFSSLFPSSVQPHAGVFIHTRMVRVAGNCR